MNEQELKLTKKQEIRAEKIVKKEVEMLKESGGK